MLSVYVPQGSSLDRREIAPDGEVPENAVWLDLVNPPLSEDKLIERLLGIAVPTREEMQEIEVSSRLYVEHHARYMTATLMCNSDTATPKTTAVTFILAGHRLVTVRYDDPRPFMIVGNKLARTARQRHRRNRAARPARRRDRPRRRHSGAHRHRGRPGLARHLRAGPTASVERALYKDILKAIGRKGDLTSKVRESLVSIGRLLLFLANEAEGMRWPKDVRLQLLRCSATCSRCPITPPI